MSDSGEGKIRRSAQAASVTNRWWEGGSAPPPPPALAPAPLAAAPTPPVCLPPPALERDHRLELELEAARAEVAALHEMLEDLPEIFERKFRQRVQGLLDEQQRLLRDNQMLRERLYTLTPSTPTARVADGRSAGSTGERAGLRRTLRDVLGSARSGRGGPAQAPAPLSRRDGGRTTAA
jgi:hypothetical protein